MTHIFPFGLLRITFMTKTRPTGPAHAKKIRGYLSVDEKTYCFLGDKEFCEVIPQRSVDVTATATEYKFENDELGFSCKFTSPLIPNDLLLTSRPCTYLDFGIDRKTAKQVTIHLLFSADIVRHTKDTVIGFSGQKTCGETAFRYGSMGRAIQQPLNQSGDFLVTIDWGYLYIACQQENASIHFDKANEQLCISIPVEADQTHADMIFAYDDLLSINYFGQWQKAYWTHTYPTILDAIGAAFADKTQVSRRCNALDQEVYENAMVAGGEDYAYLCNMAFRHTMAAHRLILDDDGNIIFLSKENNSNGCIGTADVSYPSAPLFLLYNPELVKGMLRPIFRFADCDVWNYDFAPHDVGRYPYAWGQVAALRPELKDQAFLRDQHCVYPPFYMYPGSGDIYEPYTQMPVEECGNMLIMTAAVCLHDGNAEFARPYWHLLTKWKKYLLTYGADPGDQLCTDDFTGHLAHNVNLSAKAIMGIEAYAKIAKLMYNPAAKASPPRPKAGRPDYYQPDEIEEILTALEGAPLKWKTITYLMMDTGARRGEILGLRPENVNYDEGIIVIDHALLYTKSKGVYEGETKNGKARAVMLAPQSLQLLRQWKIEQQKMKLAQGDRWNDSGYIFTQDDGERLHPDSITDWLANFSAKNDLPHIHPHAFRHTAASMMIANGVDLVTTANELGHANATTTAMIYQLRRY